MELITDYCKTGTHHARDYGCIECSRSSMTSQFCGKCEEGYSSLGKGLGLGLGLKYRVGDRVRVGLGIEFRVRVRVRVLCYLKIICIEKNIILCIANTSVIMSST